ncbi:MAG: DUF460 domain-containing protein [Candidatus Asgardarchaeum sp.]
MFIAGLDYHSTQEHSHPLFKNLFSLIIIDDRTNKVIYGKEGIPLKFVILAIRKYRPKIVAIDNFSEFGSQKELLYFLQNIPEDTKLVQITGAPGYTYESIVSIIKKKFNVKIDHKPTSIETAYFCAKLAKKKVGFSLVINYNTRVVITRARHPGKGGWSQARYQRLFQVKVKEIAKRIENALKENNIDFDKIVYETEFGYKKVIFDIYAPISDVRAIIKKEIISNADVKIKIEKNVSPYMMFLPLRDDKKGGKTLSQRYIIVGVDPGTTTGLACLDLDGNLVYLNSHKEWSRSEIIRVITEIGIPILIASDVNPPPDFVNKLASTLQIPIFYPERNLTVNEKRALVENFLSTKSQFSVNTAHERDALSAAIKAFYHYKPKLDKIEALIKSEKIPLHYKQKIKADVIRGKSIISAIREMLTKTDAEEQKPSQENVKLSADKNIISSFDKSLLDQISKLQEHISFLERENERLRLEIKNLKSIILEMDEQIKRVKENKKVTYESELTNTLLESLREENKNLRKQIDLLTERLTNLLKVYEFEKNPNIIVFKVIEKFTMDHILNYQSNLGIFPEDILYFKDGSGGGKTLADYLISLKIKAIISETPMAHIAFDKLINAGIPVILSSELKNIKFFKNFGIIPAIEFKKAIERVKKEITERQKREAELTIKRIIEEYRKNRWKS